MKIIKGKQQHAVRAVIYGPEGIGKSTLASQFPKPLILDTEDGTGQLDVDRVKCDDWSTLEGALHDLKRDRHGYQTVVIDSADWAERQIVLHILDKAKKRSIEDFGFGKGYVMVAEHVARLLTVADQLVADGMHVVFVAHCKVQRTSPPDMDEGFDRFELKLSKHTAPLFKEWCDLLAFTNYHTTVVEGADGRARGRGGKERLMHVERAAAYDAKNRYGLSSPLPMTIASLAPIFGGRPAAGDDSADIVEKARAAIDGAESDVDLARIRSGITRRAAEKRISAAQRDQLVALLDEAAARLTPQEVGDVES